MCAKQELLNYLKQYRHDWLNELQVVKGYLSLKNVEEAQRYLDQIIMRAREESKMAYLGDADFVYELMTFNWQQNDLKLQIDIEYEQWSALEKVRDHFPFLAEWLSYILQAVKKEVHPMHENRLFILLELSGEELNLVLEFMGQWQTAENQVLTNIKEKMMTQQETRTVEVTENADTDKLEWKVECTAFRS